MRVPFTLASRTGWLGAKHERRIAAPRHDAHGASDRSRRGRGRRSDRAARSPPQAPGRARASSARADAHRRPRRPHASRRRAAPTGRGASSRRASASTSARASGVEQVQQVRARHDVRPSVGQRDARGRRRRPPTSPPAAPRRSRACAAHGPRRAPRAGGWAALARRRSSEPAAGGHVDEPLVGRRRGQRQRRVDRGRLPVLLRAVARGEAVPGGDRRRVGPARDRAISAHATGPRPAVDCRSAWARAAALLKPHH